MGYINVYTSSSGVLNTPFLNCSTVATVAELSFPDFGWQFFAFFLIRLSLVVLERLTICWPYRSDKRTGVPYLRCRFAVGSLGWARLQRRKAQVTERLEGVYQVLQRKKNRNGAVQRGNYISPMESRPSLISILENSLQLARRNSTLDLSAASLYRRGSFFIS